MSRPKIAPLTYPMGVGMLRGMKTIRGKVKHSRTGACTCRRTEKCFHGKNHGR